MEVGPSLLHLGFPFLRLELTFLLGAGVVLPCRAGRLAFLPWVEVNPFWLQVEWVFLLEGLKFVEIDLNNLLWVGIWPSFFG